MDQITLRMLPAADQIRLKNSAKIAQALEDRWQAKIAGFLDAFTIHTIFTLSETGKMKAPDIEPLLVEHFFEVSIAAMKYADSEHEEYSPVGPRLASVPRVKIPNSLRGLMRLYDLWKQGKYRPKRQQKEADRIKKEYLKKVRSVWERHSEDFRSGNAFTQEVVVQKIKDEAATVTSRAKTIVRTETTNFYNAARKEFYDQSEDITHYLFIAIRDAATSPWCTPNTINGYRGRSGLVYCKTDPLCAKECPACHYGCRSEYLPLNRLNPAHLRFIQDEKIQRRNHVCFPLLKGWRS
jgi:SPP1 gp7 family putative phage head morphogenesis protein